MSIRTDGFSLVEVMVSLFIFGLLSTAATGMLIMSIRSAEALEQRSHPLQQIEVMRAMIKSDLAQMVRRGDYAAGRPGLADLTPSSVGEHRFFELSRLFDVSFLTPGAGIAIQDVTYVLRAGDIIRTEGSCDRSRASEECRERVLLSNVDGVEIAWLIGDRWIKVPAGKRAQGSVMSVPSAVSLRLQHQVFGDVEQFFLLHGGSE